MKSEWKEEKLGSLVRFSSGGTPNKNNPCYWNGSIPWISAKTMKSEVIETSDMFITEEGLIHGSRLAPKGSLLLLVRGSGLFNGIPVCYVNNAVAYNQDVKCIESISEIENKYLFYWLKANCEYLQKKLEFTSIGAGKIDISFLSNLDIRYPEKTVRKKIVDFADTISGKLRLNKKINENLEQQAVLLFRSWFTAFSQSESVAKKPSEFGQIPEDFSVVKVGSLKMLVTDYVANGSFASLKENVTLYQEPNYAYFIRNTDLKSGSFEVFVDQHSYEFLSKSTLYGGEIIISNVGDVGSVFLCPKLDGPMTLGNNIIMLRPEDDTMRYYLYNWFEHLQGQAIIQGIKGGSAQPKFNKTDFKNTSLLLPPVKLLSRFHDLVSPMFELISRNQAENKRLSAMRDTLLPKLMSGELDVSDLDL